jgi:LCP family protein required for cell wall assembly
MNPKPLFQNEYEKNITQGQRKSLFKKLFFVGIFFVACFGIGYLLATGYVLFKAQKTLHIVSTAKTTSPSVLGVAKSLLSSQDTLTPLRGEEEGRINILLLGKASKDYPGQNLTDTIIIASIDTKNDRIALMSLPRDLYVPLPQSESWSKINSVYALSQDEEDPFSLIRETLTTITDLPIHYAISIDYTAFVEMIDALGGVNIMVERDIYDTRFPGPNYSYQTFELKKGFHTLDGETALKYVRERHSDPMGDFGRAHRQQKMIQALKNKVFSTQTFLNPLAIGKLLQTLEDNVRTDIAFEEIESFIHLSKNIDLNNMETVVVDAWKPESLLRVSHVYLENGQRMFALAPRTGNFDELKQQAEYIFETSYLKERKKSIEKEKASLLLVSNGNARVAEKIKRLLSDMGFGSIRIYYEDATHQLPPKTLVKDNTGLQKPFSLDEIIKTLPAQKTQNSTLFPETIFDQEVDFIVFLGKNSSERHNWEEATLQDLETSHNEISL